MKYLKLPWIGAVAGTLLALSACSLTGGEDPTPEPSFKPGEYGGDPLPGTENLVNLRLSPDGRRVALIRRQTPDEPFDPRYQLWIVDRDGTNPELIAVNVGMVDWSPDGKTLAVAVWRGIDAYVYTIDLETREAIQWSGREDQFFSKPTVGTPIWYRDGRRLLVSVFAKDYQQPFARGIYTIDTETGQITGPHVELMQSAFLGNNDHFAIGRKYTHNRDPLNGNFALYLFEAREWKWITDFSRDSLDFVDVPVPSPTSDLAVQSRWVDNAKQLFLMDKEGRNVRQITTMGGDWGLWSYDGRQIFFRRDVHKGEGARYVPFVYDVATGQSAPLWPALPDSLPPFPPLATQKQALP
ncbi:MAG: hypothetical protein KatS3mg042_0917 [Rhodothermaceae bacterium]|nr:MAG: hypothetical protein KatS3mg042_0917 [Rhodothermaceae bacterium]